MPRRRPPSPRSPRTAPPATASLARFREAAELVRTDQAAAVKAYDALAADSSLGRALQDLAAVRAGLLLVDTAPLADLNARLEPLTTRDRTFRHTARELLALGAWRTGDQAAAQALVRHDHRRPRDAGRDAPAHRRADRARRRARQGLSRCAVRPSSLLRALGLALARLRFVRPARQVPGLGHHGQQQDAAAGRAPARCFRRACPGVPQGVPPDLVKGYQAPRRAAAAGVVEEKKTKAEAEGRGASEAEGRAQAAAAAAAAATAAAAAGRPGAGPRQRAVARAASAAAAIPAAWPADPRLATDLAEPGPARPPRR